MPVIPIVIPLLSAIILIFLRDTVDAVRRSVSLVTILVLLGTATWMVGVASSGEVHAYSIGAARTPFGIVLVLDRLAALMLLLTAIVALFAVLYAMRGKDTIGPHFHTLFQLQLVGLNGAFLTGDLFNLFVFFEILLIASYCLLIHGANAPRLRAGVHYVVLNLAGSSLFLIAVGTMYGVLGTLNMADMAGKVALLPEGDAAIIRSAAMLLFVVFALKAALVPLYFWLPNTYAAASAPVAALFAIMTKVGVYSIVRVYTLIFGHDAGVGTLVLDPWLLVVSLVTGALGAIGALGAAGLRRMFGYLLVVSVGIMLASIGLFDRDSVAAGLYYLVHSTITMAALFLLADVIARQRGDAEDSLFRGRSVSQPATLGAMYFLGAVAAVGVPPLSGFIGKLLILQSSPGGQQGFALWTIMLGGSFLTIVALARAGSIMFWKADSPRGSDIVITHRAADLAPIAGLFGVIVLATVLAGPLHAYTLATAAQLLEPAGYIMSVLPQ
jgi:multicomponent K+:H+ antiporter subunit D